MPIRRSEPDPCLFRFSYSEMQNTEAITITVGASGSSHFQNGIGLGCGVCGSGSGMAGEVQAKFNLFQPTQLGAADQGNEAVDEQI